MKKGAELVKKISSRALILPRRQSSKKLQRLSGRQESRMTEEAPRNGNRGVACEGRCGDGSSFNGECLGALSHNEISSSSGESTAGFSDS